MAILTTCDFDFSFPATQAAGAKKVLGLSLCASSPKAATPAIVSQYGGSMGLGSDTEGTAMAEWFRAHKPALKRAWIVKDLSLEYSKATADYFKARWKQLGGTVCGEDTFTAGDNLDLSSNVTRLRGAVSKCDVIYDGSWNPFGAQYVRAVRDAGIKTTIITNASVNGLPVVQNNPGLSNFYALGFACLNTYCKGSKNPAVAKVNAEFKEKYGQPIGNHYALPGYELADALVAAIKKAGSTDGTKISQPSTTRASRSRRSRATWPSRRNATGRSRRSTPSSSTPAARTSRSTRPRSRRSPTSATAARARASSRRSSPSARSRR